MRWIFSSPADVDHAKVVAAIRAAEAVTSGEIRVVLARHRARDPLAAAQKHFTRLGMDRTQERNGVLIFVAPRSRNFAIVGDQGIHEKCGDAFWTAVAGKMSAYFKQGDFTAGLLAGIGEAAGQLAAHFPRQAGAPNQLPDDIEEVD